MFGTLDFVGSSIFLLRILPIKIVSKRKCDAIISYIEDVAKRFSDYMEMAGVREKTCQIMNDIIISNNIRKTGD